MADVTPIHPGAVVAKKVAELNITMHRLALAMEVSPSTVQRLVKGEISLSPEMAYRLSKVIGGTPQSWLAKQAEFDIEMMKSTVDVSKLKRLV